MAAFVLIHGGWHGGWCWRRVAPLLRAEGHEVFAPTLTGLGERAHLLSPDVGLGTHVQDVLGVLEYEDPRDVVLVVHSSAGAVVTVVADRAPERVAHLVYLDAPIPRDGQSHADCLWSVANRAAADNVAATQGEGYWLPAPPPAHLGIADEADARWVASKLTPHPYKTLTDPVRLAGASGKRVQRAYISCVGSMPLLKPRAPWARGMRYYALKTGHAAMITAPRELAALLLDLAPMI